MRTFALTLASLALAAALPVPGDQANQASQAGANTNGGPGDLLSSPMNLLGGGDSGHQQAPGYQEQDTDAVSSPVQGGSGGPLDMLSGGGNGGPLNMLSGGGDGGPLKMLSGGGQGGPLNMLSGGGNGGPLDALSGAGHGGSGGFPGNMLSGLGGGDSNGGAPSYGGQK